MLPICLFFNHKHNLFVHVTYLFTLLFTSILCLPMLHTCLLFYSQTQFVYLMLLICLLLFIRIICLPYVTYLFIALTQIYSSCTHNEVHN